VYKSLKRLIPIGLSEDWLRSKFGSADYNAAGAMRGILVKTVNEDLSETAARVACHTLLIYGQNDTETPPEIGTRLAKLIPAAELVVLDGQDHYSVLAQGRHPVAHLIKRFITDT
ncbi:MAG: alpha/beta fold hydrolase, partial [Bdellovibrionales bacterium]